MFFLNFERQNVFHKRMEISPFFWEKNGDFSILFFLTPIQHFFWFSLPKKKEWRNLHSKKKISVFTLKNMLKNAYFFQFWASKRFSKKKNGDFSILSKKNGDFSILSKKNGDFSVLSKKMEISPFSGKRMEISPFFWKRMEISPFYFPTPFSNMFMGFHYTKKRKEKKRRKLQSQKKRFHLQHADFLFLSVKTFFTTK